MFDPQKTFIVERENAKFKCRYLSIEEKDQIDMELVCDHVEKDSSSYVLFGMQLMLKTSDLCILSFERDGIEYDKKALKYVPWQVRSAIAEEIRRRSETCPPEYIALSSGWYSPKKSEKPGPATDATQDNENGCDATENPTKNGTQKTHSGSCKSADCAGCSVPAKSSKKKSSSKRPKQSSKKPTASKRGSSGQKK